MTWCRQMFFRQLSSSTRKATRTVRFALFAALLVVFLITSWMFTSTMNENDLGSPVFQVDDSHGPPEQAAPLASSEKAEGPADPHWHRVKGEAGERHQQDSSASSDSTTVDYEVHVFYYPWYGNPEHDGAYYHWNHRFLPHWNPIIAAKWPNGRHQPPDDLGANYYPALGCYSSRDERVLEQHMQWIRRAGIGVIVLSWYPPEKADSEGKPWDALVPSILDAAFKEKLKVTFLIEPYDGRSGRSLYSDFRYLVDKYGTHRAFYRYYWKAVTKPLVYVYDSYLVSNEEWKSLLREGGNNSIRGTAYDCFVLGLLVKDAEKHRLVSNGFDGCFTYFASTRFSYGSTPQNWRLIANFAKRHGLIFSPSVGPGYVDERIRPWNQLNTRERQKGDYYRKMWSYAAQSHSPLISVTSFNEWHEGTQIEPAAPQHRAGREESKDGKDESKNKIQYLDYSPMAPDFYLTLTREMISNKKKPSLAQ